jgi:uroporphyrinogen-III synthase
MQNVLVTRTENQSGELVQTLYNQGFSTFIEPLFTVEKIKATTKIQPTISTIIITSANAIYFLLDLNFPKDGKIFAVGKKTAQKLHENGFRNVVFPQENSAAALLELIKETHFDKNGLSLYLHGSIINLDFEQELKKLNFNIVKFLAYKTSESTVFSSQLLEFSQQKNFDYILFFSGEGVKTFFQLAKNHNLLEYFRQSQLLCLSERILSEVRKFNFENSATFNQFPILKKFYE